MKPEQALRDLFIGAMREHQDQDAAYSAAKRQIESDPQFLPLVIDRAIRSGLAEARHLVRVSINTSTPISINTKPTEEEVDAVLQRKLRAGDWPLASGRELRRATLLEVHEQQQVHLAHARGNQRAADFLAAVEDRARENGAQNGDAIERFVSEEDLDVIHASVYGFDVPGSPSTSPEIGAHS